MENNVKIAGFSPAIRANRKQKTSSPTDEQSQVKQLAWFFFSHRYLDI
jgi:hypothetical protein